jgi:hypothetical protein
VNRIRQTLSDVSPFTGAPLSLIGHKLKTDRHAGGKPTDERLQPMWIAENGRGWMTITELRRPLGIIRWEQHDA